MKSMNTRVDTTNTMNLVMLFLPMHLEVQGQWWSIPSTHTLQILQCWVVASVNRLQWEQNLDKRVVHGFLDLSRVDWIDGNPRVTDQDADIGDVLEEIDEDCDGDGQGSHFAIDLGAQDSK